MLTNTFRYRAVIVLMLVTTAVSCSSGKDSVFKKTRPLMDTMVSITVVTDSKDRAEKAIENAFAEISRFGDLIDFYSEKSELAGINRNAGLRSVKVSPETLDVIEKAVFAAERSGGAFDPTIGPIVKLWDFLNKKKPTGAAIAEALPLVNYKDILIDSPAATVFLKRKGMMIDLGGIAKGYAADLAVESLKKTGILSGLVSIAGDIRTFGRKPDKSPWTIGIKNPRQTGEKDEIIAKIRLDDEAISTSGDYERYFISDDKRYHHLLDPKTGMPAFGCRSVSIVTDKAVNTDAFSTAVFILGPEKGMKLMREMGMDAMVIDGSGTIHITDAIKEKITHEKGH
ncbi:MAG: FAD:protein FMN transferase [Nitrospirae bacterium]|nr:FAD:protein FMN transferase [Nitrospirota bacterium]